MAKKNTGRRRFKAKPRTYRPERTDVPLDDAPPVMSAVQLAKKYNVNDETIRLWSKLPEWTPQCSPGKWVAADFDRCKKLLDEYGSPKRWHQAIAEQRVPERVRREAHIGGLESAYAADEAAQEEGSEATTTAELMRMKSEKLQKAKLAEEVLTRRLANQERKRSLVRRAVVEEVIMARAQHMKTLAKRITLELPPRVLGLERPEVEKRIDEAFQEFFGSAAAFGAAMVAGPAAPVDQAEATAAPDRGESSKGGN